jgi:hypothetical protein
MNMKKIFLISVFSSLLILSGCSSGGGGDAAQNVVKNATVSISGTLIDASASPSAPLAGVKVEGIYTGSLPGSSDTTDASGSYSVTMLKKTDFYLRASISSYLTINSAIKNLATNDTGNDIDLPTTTDANMFVSTVFNSPGKTIAGSAWLVVDVVDANGSPVPGVSVVVDITPDNDEYPDCSGLPSGGSATANCPSGSEAPSYMAEYGTIGKVTVTVNGVQQQGFLATDEALYMEFEQ